jgi:hypothetical protein
MYMQRMFDVHPNIGSISIIFSRVTLTVERPLSVKFTGTVSGWKGFIVRCASITIIPTLIH